MKRSSPLSMPGKVNDWWCILRQQKYDLKCCKGRQPESDFTNSTRPHTSLSAHPNVFSSQVPGRFPCSWHSWEIQGWACICELCRGMRNTEVTGSKSYVQWPNRICLSSIRRCWNQDPLGTTTTKGRQKGGRAAEKKETLSPCSFTKVNIYCLGKDPFPQVMWWTRTSFRFSNNATWISKQV